MAEHDMHGGYGRCNGRGSVWVDDGEASGSYTQGTCPDCARSKADRFFIDHGVIHDRKTGKHVRTDTPDWLNDDGINEALALLNELHHARAA